MVLLTWFTTWWETGVGISKTSPAPAGTWYLAPVCWLNHLAILLATMFADTVQARTASKVRRSVRRAAGRRWHLADWTQGASPRHSAPTDAPDSAESLQVFSRLVVAQGVVRRRTTCCTNFGRFTLYDVVHS